MTDIEIPYKENRDWKYRLLEIMPGTLSWSMLLLPLILSYIDVTIASIFILAYLLLFFARSVGVNSRALQGYHTMEFHRKLPWRAMTEELVAGVVTDPQAKRPDWHLDNILRLQTQPPIVPADQVIHAAMIATYNETREVLEPTIQSVIASDFDMKKVILVLAYEERGGERVAEQAEALMAEYSDVFLHAMAVKHPRDIPGELRGKGGNITYAGRELQKYLAAEKIDPNRVIVTTLDADNRPDKKYLAALTYVYSLYPEPARVSIQPISMYTNNIWDAPAPMRVIATGNTFYNIVLALRPHMLRNFSAHAQSMQSLIETDFWSVRTIVEDGHQFWRSYFRFDGNYRVLPLYVPIYQDAVLADGYLKTFKAQFIQLRRWTWGASDIAYVISQGYFKKNKVPRLNLLTKTLRLVEGHITWAVAPIISLTAGFIPALFHDDSYAANELPIIVSRIQTVALIGIFASLYICFKTLPPKPARYKRHRNLFMVLQWLYLPITTIVFNSFAALNSQTRLMFGWYLDKFDVTEKAVVTTEGATISQSTKE
ncbi:MAG TPA: glycosyltransferase family 2 protein [Candidatus Limnocylindrales bacterium]|nr:glycosyltransferase family 2 protein [Candidatus Limnocylindrales bacterium]